MVSISLIVKTLSGRDGSLISELKKVRFDLLSELIKCKLIRIAVENDLVCNSARIRFSEKNYANSLLFNQTKKR